METLEEHGKYSTKATGIVTETQQFLSKLGQGYKRAKAQQILRLLKDQESLNRRFKDCALDDGQGEESFEDASGTGTNITGSTDKTVGNHNDVSNIGNVGSALYKSRSGGLKKVSASVDPSRCRTSMGFYNEAECSGSMDGDFNHDRNDEELDADLDFSFDTRDLLMAKSSTGPRPRNPRHHLTRLKLQDDPEVLVEESVVQSARSSRPKTGIISSSARNKQYRRPAQNNSQGQAVGNTTVTTSVSKLEAPFTPRGGVRGFCEGQLTPRDNIVTLSQRPSELSLCLSPRKNDVSACFTPRLNEGSLCYTPRQKNNVNGHYTPRQHENFGFNTPRYNDLSVGNTPRQREMPSSSRHNEVVFSDQNNELSLCLTPRSMNPQRGSRGFVEGQVTPRDDKFNSSVPLQRRDDMNGGITPRPHHKFTGSINAIHNSNSSTNMKNGRVLETSLFEMVPTFNPEPIRSKRIHESLAKTDNGHHVSPRTTGAHLTRTMLTVDHNPLNVIQGSEFEGEMTPRRQKADTKGKKTPRGCGEMQRAGVHQNLNQLSERVHPISVMKLPPLEAAINKPMMSQGM